MRKMKNKAIKCIIFTIATMMVLTACGASGDYDSSVQSDTMTNEDSIRDYEDSAIYQEEYIDEYQETTTNEKTVETEGNQPDTPKSIQSMNRKLIKEVELSVETENRNSLIDKVENQIKELGGYVQSLSTDGNYDEYYTDDTVIVARIPQEKLDDFVQSVEDHSNITRRSENVEDVTLHYADTEGQKAMYRAEQEKLYI